MQKYAVSQFDINTFVVFDQDRQLEVRVCSNYDDIEDAELRAMVIATSLNKTFKDSPRFFESANKHME